MFNLTRKPKKARKPHLQACTCLVNIAYCCSNVTSKAAQMEKKPFLAVRDGRLHCRRSAFSKVHKGPQERQDIAERLMNGKANCFALRKRITRLKKVNSVIRSVTSHPKKGCLQWLHGTMSESLWILH